MNISTTSLWNPLHHIFDTAMIRAGSSMRPDESMAAWSRAGLSQEYLADALESLSLAGYLRLADSTPGWHPGYGDYGDFRVRRR